MSMRFYAMKTFVLFFIFSQFFFACATVDRDLNTAEGLYDYARDFDENERYEIALTKYAEVKNKFPYSKLATESELAIADVYYKRESYAEAEVSYQNFRDLHPKHPRSDYVLYKVAMSFYMQLPETTDRDLTAGKDAIYHFDQLIKLYPKSQYVIECKTKRDEIYNKLAEKEIYIADFYYNQEMYMAALRRYESSIAKYPGLGFDPRSHYGAFLSAKKLKDEQKQKYHAQLLMKKYPKSDEAQKVKSEGL